MSSTPYSPKAFKLRLQLSAVALVLCVAAVGAMATRSSAALARNQRAALSIQAARARLERANERRSLVERYQAPYQSLLRGGATARFDRAAASDWFEAATRSAGARAITDYVIGKDLPFSGAETADLSAFNVVAHRLEFNASAADEDRFAELMGALEKRLPGTTAQEACAVTRNARSTEDTDWLKLHCALVWYEFRPAAQDGTATLAGVDHVH